MTLLGELALWLALPMAAWASVASFAGAARARRELAESGRRALRASLALLALSTAALANALLARDVSLSYVAAQVSENLPTPYALAALWSGGAGSLLLTALLLALFGALASASAGERAGAFAARCTGVVAATIAAVTALVAFSSQPFAREVWLPPDGRGMNPQLQHPSMFVHPLLVLAGGAATIMPFALAIAASLAPGAAGEWLGRARRWALVAWIVIGAGIAIGMRWAYVELGWGGVWRWDPVQSSALLTWLALAAFLHAAAVARRHALVQRWTASLAAAPFLCTLFAAWAARSGALPGVHAFARSREGVWVALLLAAAAIAAARLLGRRLPGQPARGHQRQSLAILSREGAALAGSALLVVIAFAVLWGALFPALAEWVNGGGEAAAVGPHWYSAVLSPLTALALAAMSVGVPLAWRGGASLERGVRWRLLLALVVAAGTAVALGLAGVRLVRVVVCASLAAAVLAATMAELATIVARRRTSAEWGSRARRAPRWRAVGPLLAHAGIAVAVLGFAGLPYVAERAATLGPGDALLTSDPFGRDWRFVNQSVSLYDAGNQRVAAVAIEASRDGRRMGLMRTSKRQSVDAQGNEVFRAETEVAILSTPATDVRVVLQDLERETATLRVSFRPMTFWIWTGAGLVTAAGIVILLASFARSGLTAMAATPTPDRTASREAVVTT